MQRITRRARVSLSALTAAAVLSLWGCEAEQSNVGSCTIESQEDGRSILRCPDGSEHLLGQKLEGDGQCSVSTAVTGVVTLSCPDSAPLVIDPSQGSAPGGATCKLVKEDAGHTTLRCGSDAFRLDQGCADGYDGDLWIVDPAYGEIFEDLPYFNRSVDNAELMSSTVFELLGCRRVNGNINVAGWQQPSLPVALANVEFVEGDVSIQGNPGLTSVNLPNLRRIGGQLRVVDNSRLQSFQGLSALAQAGSFGMWDNANVDGCEAATLRDRVFGSADAAEVESPPDGEVPTIGECP